MRDLHRPDIQWNVHLPGRPSVLLWANESDKPIGEKVSYEETNEMSAAQYQKLSAGAMLRKLSNDFQIMIENGYDYRYSIGRDINDFFYMITVRYRKSTRYGNSSLDQHIENINADFAKLHQALAKHLIGGNISRRNHLQPMCWMFIDGAATRGGGYFANSRAGEGTHHHGIMLLHPSTLKDFEKMNNKLCWTQLMLQVPNIAEVDIQPVRDVQSIGRVVDYSRKLEKQLGQRSQIGANMEFNMPHYKDGELMRLTPPMPADVKLVA